ncbi:MAG: hypothetical protein ACOCUS_02475 [Polyangiales bacterium]
MATKKRGKRKTRKTTASVASVPAATPAGAKVEPAAKPKPKRKAKPEPKPPRRPARRKSPRRSKPQRPKPTRKRKPSATVAARRVASRGGKRIAHDARSRKRAEGLVNEIRQRKKRITGDFYAMGEALKTLSRPSMYGALGHESFERMLVERELVSASTAYKLMAVVEAYPRKQALELGLEKAYGLVRWTEATGQERSPSELAASNALIGDRRVHDISSRALQDRLRHARETIGASAGDGRVQSGKNAERIARRMQREMRAQGLEGVRARARRVRGQWYVTLEVLASEAEAWLQDGAAPT